ncbi:MULTISPECIES: LysR substrate-binding domain-containing protein [Halomonadaceae]|jgi:LysR family glycine cleavage system transcriptional activator|uniref:LysR family transcriptional regulator n=1 Tax=Vreelandella piezotolerans TaxID=2609667 RepID=A0ABQ6X5Z3_9GAMM|nr:MULTISPECIES: LysR substrate-binding domain-containing protein [Halomonas]MEE3111204.1 LysR substrate-binding domain-containing protein [Pseudomonadota bacterium]KAE8437412.1 LysR family transcriptional regulator [Halomonas piezotolerans]MCG7578286.1 LysR substrate-binding domain-containing protein [Halomonas sp. MMH1-48]MCG7592018.1 LysR substrate-binding domain-containing protein [Halomonas sp. McD50-5]MCG7605345.1 LysR substrate-binding domain-containing protein [Halomonas sp. MM17-34]
MSSLPPLLWLQAFESAARTLSFTAAGNELGVTQAAISQRIRLLEDRLGQKLFVRHARSLSLTPAGQAWLPSIHDAFSRISEGTSEVFGITSERPVTLRATPVIQQSWLAPRLVALHRQKPTILLRLVSAIWPDDFGPEGADIEIRYGRGEWSGLEMLPLGDEHLLPVCAPALARSLNVPADLAGHTLLHAVGFGVGWPGWLQAAGIAHLESECRSLTCDNQVMTLALASQGGGVALTHHRLLEQREDLVAPFDMSVPSDERFWLVRPSKRQVSDEAADVWAWLAASRELP